MTKQSQTKAITGADCVLTVFGIGGAGCNAVEHMAGCAFEGPTFIALNTDIRALAGCRNARTLPLGPNLTRGLGAGGDPEIGRAAAEQDADALRELCDGTDMVMIVTGLGGGTGTGASPVVARIAREAGALVMAVATLPFECEGTRRKDQAQAGLDQLKEAADAVLCLPNERVLQVIDENTSIVETFQTGNELLAQGVRGIWRLLTRNGIIHVDFADLCSVVRGRHAESYFASVEARGEHRSREVVEKLMSSPLLEAGAVLNGAESILVSLVGGVDLTMAEVRRIMAQIGRACENARVVMGAAVDDTFKERLAATVIATRPAASGSDVVLSAAGESPDEPSPALPDLPPAGEARGALDDQLLSPARTKRPSSRFIPPPPALTAEQKEQMLARQTAGKAGRTQRIKLRQGVLPLEIISKGRFEKIEPTIYHGEDLDVPTYIRRGVPLN